MPGVGVSILMFAVGAVLYWGLTVAPTQHGFNIHNIGIILMIVAGVGFVLSLLFWLPMTMRRRRVTYQDGSGYVRQDEVQTYR